MEGKVCSKCGVWKPLEEYNKNKNCKGGRLTVCRECQKKYQKQWKRNNLEHNRQYRENNKEHIKEYQKQWRRNNPEYVRQYREDNIEYIKERDKQYRENNKEYKKEYLKQWHQNNKQNNLQYISSIVEQTNMVYKQLNLPVYGYIYKFENVKTGKVYIGQTRRVLKQRYKAKIINGWIKERKKYEKQKFLEELIEEDIKLTEVLDVGCCQYHLDKLEAYYIAKYDSCDNGYNNEHGKHITDNGIEEFNQILLENNLEFIDGKLVKIA
jgi:hypothetical protein